MSYASKKIARHKVKVLPDNALFRFVSWAFFGRSTKQATSSKAHISKYMPHQGKQECARRVRQMEKHA